MPKQNSVQNSGQIGPAVFSDIHTYTHTDRDYNFSYIDVYIVYVYNVDSNMLGI